MYLAHKTYVSGTAAWFMGALDVTNGQERAGSAVRLDGNADNNSATSFFARDQQQRPGLLLMNGLVLGGVLVRDGHVLGLAEPQPHQAPPSPSRVSDLRRHPGHGGPRPAKRSRSSTAFRPPSSTAAEPSRDSHRAEERAGPGLEETRRTAWSGSFPCARAVRLTHQPLNPLTCGPDALEGRPLAARTRRANEALVRAGAAPGGPALVHRRGGCPGADARCNGSNAPAPEFVVDATLRQARTRAFRESG